MKTEENIIKRMRDTLVPQGTLPIVRLHTGETNSKKVRIQKYVPAK
jgi:hypothetical protein